MDKRTILVTGASSGIGFAIVSYLSNLGYTVLATTRQLSGKNRLEDLESNFIYPVFPLDLTDKNQVKERATEIINKIIKGEIPPLEAVIFVAGGGHIAPVELMNLEHFKEELDVRLLSTVQMLQHFIPLLRKTKGKIIWIATPGLFPVPFVADIHACDNCCILLKKGE